MEIGEDCKYCGVKYNCWHKEGCPTKKKYDDAVTWKKCVDCGADTCGKRCVKCNSKYARSFIKRDKK